MKPGLEQGRKCPCGTFLPIKQKMFFVDDSGNPLCHRCLVKTWSKWTAEENAREKEQRKKEKQEWLARGRGFLYEEKNHCNHSNHK